jgi:hypothetical protein
MSHRDFRERPSGERLVASLGLGHDRLATGSGRGRRERHVHVVEVVVLARFRGSERDHFDAVAVSAVREDERVISQSLLHLVQHFARSRADESVRSHE